MHFVTEIGCFMFAYPYIEDGDLLDFEYFWGGRTSCKTGVPARPRRV
jgi:hypothetical protein